MQLDLDLSGRRVVIVGCYPGARRAITRFRAAGARVRVVGADPAPTRRELLKIIGPAWMVVTVGADNTLRDRIRELCTQLSVLLTDEPAASEVGSVTLVGGGPGVTGLLTLDACEALRNADLVFYDRLAPSKDLAALAPAAELVDVGKSPYHHRIPQHRIEEEMIMRARQGLAVVRLKGGDPFVFGRGGEEMLACAQAGVAVRVIPGVSSAISVPASGGIPVTHRGLSHAFTVISGHVPPSERELAGLVRLGGTVVILMGVANLPQICSGLERAGLGGGTPCAVVERGFSESQRTTVTTLAELPVRCRMLDVQSPAVVVVGEVARLGSSLAETLDLAAAHRTGSG